MKLSSLIIAEKSETETAGKRQVSSPQYPYLLIEPGLKLKLKILPDNRNIKIILGSNQHTEPHIFNQAIEPHKE